MTTDQSTVDRRATLELAVTEAEASGDAHALGLRLRDLGDDDSTRSYAAARATYERALLAFGTAPSVESAQTMYRFANCHFRDGNFADAGEWFERAANVRRFLVQGIPADNEFVGKCLHMRAFAMARLGHIDQAILSLKEVIPLKELGDEQGRVDHESIGQTYNLWAEFLGQNEAAIECYENAILAKERGDLDGKIDSASIGVSLFTGGKILVALDRLKEAFEWFERAVPAFEKGDLNGYVDKVYLSLSIYQCGRSLAHSGRIAEAIPWLLRATAAQAQDDRVNHDAIGTTWNLLGDCHAHLQDSAQAIDAYEHAVREYEQGDRNGTVYIDSVGESLRKLGTLQFDDGKYDAALPTLIRAVAAFEQGLNEGSVSGEDLAAVLTTLAYCYAGLERTQEAALTLVRCEYAKRGLIQPTPG